jgi:O-antigen/teichoic acid export membrane protein
MLTARWRPTFVIDRAILGKLRSYAGGVAGFSLLNQITRYGDNLLVGAFLGSTALGYYAMAYRFIEVPVGQVGAAAQSVVFPTLARIGDADRFREALLRSQKVLVWLVAPVGVCSMAVGDVAVRAILGQQWKPAGLIVQVFGAVGLLQAAGTQVGVIYLARDATSLLLRWALISTPIIFGSFAIGLIGGIQGVAWAYLAAGLVLFWPGWQIPGRLIGLTTPMVLRNLKVELGWGFGLAATVLALRLRLPIQSTASVIVTIIVLSAVYWIGSVLIDPRLRTDVLRLVDARLTPIPDMPESQVQ